MIVHEGTLLTQNQIAFIISKKTISSLQIKNNPPKVKPVWLQPFVLKKKTLPPQVINKIDKEEHNT